MEHGSDTAASALRRIDARDGAIRAWTAVDRTAAAAQPGPLAGLTLGVKDIIDVAGLVTGCGSPIHSDRRATADAALVAELRALGVAVLGKTAAAELAFLSPPPTRNPLDPRRSPGGSSSGSAAAVADGHVDAALATQTAGSIIRPASFCGVVGFMPSHGRFALAGVKPAAPSFDTIGWITRDVATAIRIGRALAPAAATASSSARIAFCRTNAWDRADEAMRGAALDLARARDLPELPPFGAWLDHAQATVMRFEMRRELATERLQHASLLSPLLRDFLEGDPVPERLHREALAALRAVDIDALFGRFDVVATPAACGEAVPFGSTGDPAFNRFATALGLPAVTIPFARGPLGLPLGLQLLGRPGEDAVVLETARVLEAAGLFPARG